MTGKQALTKACRLFGKTAAVKKGKCYPVTSNLKPDGLKVSYGCSAYGAHLRPCPCGVPVYTIGLVDGVGGIRFFVVKAEGHTWEAAFEKHEANVRREHEEYEAMRKKHAGAVR
jgi:hypothetical protein